VRQWAEGERAPGEETQQHLRVGLQVALMLNQSDGPEVTQAWFQGLNPELEDRSPARLLRDGDLHEAGPAVIAAARRSSSADDAPDDRAARARLPSPPALIGHTIANYRPYGHELSAIRC
jgi:hypothetical protein